MHQTKSQVGFVYLISPPFSLLLPQTSSILFVTTSLKTQADALTSYPLANNSLRDFSDFSTLHHHPKNHNHPNPSYHQSIPTLPSRFTDIHVFQAFSGLKRALFLFFSTFDRGHYSSVLNRIFETLATLIKSKKPLVKPPLSNFSRISNSTSERSSLQGSRRERKNTSVRLPAGHEAPTKQNMSRGGNKLSRCRG